MKQTVAIYLAGPIQKGHERHGTFWTDADANEIRARLPQAILLNPAVRSDDLSDSYSVFGRDMLCISSSQAVFVDARDRRGLGVGAEMMWAKMNRIPVVAWAPKGTHYHKAETTILGVPVHNFVHPFVFSLSDKIVETPAEGADWIASIMANPIPIKGPEHIDLAMDHYKKTQSHRDSLPVSLQNCP